MKNRICGVYADVLVLDKPFHSYFATGPYTSNWICNGSCQTGKKLYFFKRLLAYQVSILMMKETKKSGSCMYITKSVLEGTYLIKQ